MTHLEPMTRAVQAILAGSREPRTTSGAAAASDRAAEGAVAALDLLAAAKAVWVFAGMAVALCRGAEAMA